MTHTLPNGNLRGMESVFTHAAIGVAITTLDGRFVDVNDAFSRITGYTLKELRQTDFLSITHPDYRRSNAELARKLLAGEMPAYILQKEYIKKSGDLVWVQNSISVVRDDEGNPVNLISFCEDITERRVVQTALLESEERFRVQFKATPVPIFSWRRVAEDFVLVDYNEAADRITAHGIINLLGRRASHLYLETPEVLEGMNACFLQKKTIRKAGEFRLLSTGELKYFDVSFVFVPPNLVMIHTEDITERKRAEQARLEAEQKYRDIFENANEGIFQSTEAGCLLTANPALARILGYESPEELIPERTQIATQHFVDPGRREEMKRLVASSGVVRGFEYEAYRKDGSRIWMSESIRGVRDPDGRILYYEGIAEDITNRKEAESALRDFSRRLLEAQESERKHIARELHDEIGQVLTAVRINLTGLEQICEASAMAAGLREGIRVIDEALGRVRDLSFELRPSLLDDLGLGVATRWYVDRYTKRAGIKASIQIDCDLSDKRLPREVETACFRILQESLTNIARHACARHVVVSLAAADSSLVLSVRDDGVGMERSNALNRENQLNTLGLRGMEERARAVSGRIEILSDLSRGTEVKATFPIYRATAATPL